MNDWVVVRSCSWVQEARLLTSLLDSAGIESLIPDEFTLSVQPLYAPLLGGVRIFVRQADAERARELLDSAPPTPASGDRDWATRDGRRRRSCG